MQCPYQPAHRKECRQCPHKRQNGRRLDPASSFWPLRAWRHPPGALGRADPHTSKRRQPYIDAVSASCQHRDSPPTTPSKVPPVAKSDHAEFIAFSRRIMRALSTRLGQADPEDLAEMIELSRTLDSAIGAAVRAQRANGFSWTEIAAPLGISRQAAQQRWGKLVDKDDDK